LENTKREIGELTSGLFPSVIVIHKVLNEEAKKCIESVHVSAGNLNPPLKYEVLTSATPNKSLARNELCGLAKGNILVFLDSDAQASDFWLHELLKPFKDPSIAVVGGCNILRQDASKREELADKILTFPLATWKSSSRYRVCGKIREVDESELTSCNLAIRKQSFVDAGGFPLNFIPCEENVLMNNIESLGYKMVYNPLAIVFHSRDPLFKPHLKKMFYYGWGRGKMWKHHKGRIKFFPKPSIELSHLLIGLVTHYIAYFSGLVWGLIKN